MVHLLAARVQRAQADADVNCCQAGRPRSAQAGEACESAEDAITSARGNGFSFAIAARQSTPARLDQAPIWLCCSGCAFLFKAPAGEATEKTFHVDSSPPGANVTVDGRSYGQTPVDVYLPREHGVTIVVTKDGYQEGDLVPHRHPDLPWVIWDAVTCIAFFVCIIPILADQASHAWSTYDGDSGSVQLKPVPPPPPAISPAASPPSP